MRAPFDSAGLAVDMSPEAIDAREKEREAARRLEAAKVHFKKTGKVLPEFRYFKTGKGLRASDGRLYRVAKDGSFRKVLPEGAMILEGRGKHLRRAIKDARRKLRERGQAAQH